MWRSFEESIEIIPAKNVRGRRPERIVAGAGQVEFAEESVLVTDLLQDLRRRDFEGRYLGVRQIITENRSLDVCPKRIAALKEDGATRRALGHRPDIAETHSGTGDRIDIRREGRRTSSIAEDLHLIDPDIIHDDEQDVWTRLSTSIGLLRVCRHNLRWSSSQRLRLNDT